MNPRVFLWAVAMGPVDSGGVCSMGAHRKTLGSGPLFDIETP